MDRSNEMQLVRRSLEQGEEMVRNHQAGRDDMDSDLMVVRLESDVRRDEQKSKYDDYIAKQRALLEKALENSRSDLAKSVRTQHIGLLNRALNDQCAMYEKKIQQERTLSSHVLENTRAENEANLKKERDNFDSAIQKARKQLEESENELLKLKTLLESFIQREEQDMIHIPRRRLPYVIDHECGPHVVMRFKIHKVQEIYSDLQKYYDSREELSEIAISEPDTVDYSFLSQHLTEFYGYVGGALLYYLNPAPGSQPSKELVQIDGPEDFEKMMAAHAHQSKKICHLYIVNGTEFVYYDEEDRPYHYDEEDAKEVCRSGRAEVTSPVTKKPRTDK